MFLACQQLIFFYIWYFVAPKKIHSKIDTDQTFISVASIGDVIGERSLLTQHSNSAGIHQISAKVMSEKSELLFICKKAFHEIIHEHVHELGEESSLFLSLFFFPSFFLLIWSPSRDPFFPLVYFFGQIFIRMNYIVMSNKQQEDTKLYVEILVVKRQLITSIMCLLETHLIFVVVEDWPFCPLSILFYFFCLQSFND